MSGRLLCDTFIASKDLINAKSYNLSELSKSQLNISRDEIKSDEVAQFYQNSTSLIDLITHCSFDAYLSLRLMFKLQILPLTKQLTNLSGNKWSKSMYGARSDRNEHLLLHTFYSQGYVYPNKYAHYVKKKEFVASKIELDVNTQISSQLADTDQPSTEKFSGGLVLDPKTGYYDSFVILLDFNSLYPSIIQEYNVCFTTRNDLELSQKSGDYDDDNDGDISRDSILPSLVKVLVQKRKEIKSLMKDPHISESKKSQYDIQQMALKLTANSMYGCLGSSFSRFYAKDLAMFITFMGRTILKNTVDLAEEMGLDVIYGDTDSIMIDTKDSDLSKAKDIAKMLQDKVNERYKLLEIGVDGYFKHTLLLKKKKYAALVLEERKDGESAEKILSKGLDLVRRDWCDLSHDISGFVLKLILNSDSIKDVPSRVVDYLKTRLNKALSEYDKSKGYHHIIVARKMRQTGMNVSVGDIVPYVMCVGRYKAIPTIPEDALIGNAKLDINWYLSQQILPPVSRLCTPLHDITNKELILALGVDDTIDVQETVIKEDPDGEVDHQEEDNMLMNTVVLDRNTIEKNRFVLHCSKCLENNVYGGPIRRDHNGRLMCGLLCSYCNTMSMGSIVTQVILEIRKRIDEYYSSPFICNNEWCGTVAYDTMVMNNQNCPNITCRGKLVRKFSDNLLYSRLTYLYSLFDTTTIKLEDYKGDEPGCIEGYREKSSFRFIRFFDVLDEDKHPPAIETVQSIDNIEEIEVEMEIEE
ncbi:hypothetical protein K501DRAFT_279596 [Backusella circina FSU 941]|nr:hypothetical protein K501DRAFT_279596 [Backusella circina FSU 941]